MTAICGHLLGSIRSHQNTLKDAQEGRLLGFWWRGDGCMPKGMKRILASTVWRSGADQPEMVVPQ